MTYSSYDISSLQCELAPEICKQVDMDPMPERFRAEPGFQPKG